MDRNREEKNDGAKGEAEDLKGKDGKTPRAETPEKAPGRPDASKDDESEKEFITPEVVGVRLRRAGRLQYFRPQGLDPKPGEAVIVEAERGLALGKAVQGKKTIRLPKNCELKRIIRIADARDELIRRDNEKRNRRASELCLKFIGQLDLKMNLIEVEYQHSANKAVFYFSADGRVDFRELVRMLAQELRIRVEMRQIGIRDEAKLLGGLGPCGQPICCSSFLDEFRPVSIRQAKEQNLTLNPEKVSGLCGRLMCCLEYESHAYREIQKGLPKIGKKTDTWRGRGRVQEINIFTRKMRLELDGNGVIIIGIDDFHAYQEDPEGVAKRMAEQDEKEKGGRWAQVNYDRLPAGGGGEAKKAEPSKDPRDDGAGAPQKRRSRGRGKRPRKDHGDAPPAGKETRSGESDGGAHGLDKSKQKESDDGSTRRRERGGRRRRRPPKNKTGGKPKGDGGAGDQRKPVKK